MAIRTQLRHVIEAQGTLAQPDARALMEAILAGEASEIELAGLLGAMAARGETAEEIAGFAQALRAAATPLPLSDAERAELVDTCGTGGDGSGSFNISTAAALVAAAAGAKVAKHGNRAVTSQCGSADVLEALGVPVELAPDAAARQLRECGFCFLLAPGHHPALRAVMPVRRELGVRTVLHVLGPLLNPAGAQRQVMGVYASRLVRPVAEAMRLLGTTHAMVVHGDPPRGDAVHTGQDELALSGPSEVAEVRGEIVTVRTLEPWTLNLQPAPLQTLTGGDATLNAAILTSVFAGERGSPAAQARRDVVVLNAAAVLVVAGLAPSLNEGARLAERTIDDGAVTALLKRLRAR